MWTRSASTLCLTLRRGDRLRDLVHARADRPPPALADQPGHPVTGILYTIPSIAAFFLLLPLTGRGNDTALIALVAYMLLIIFRNVLTGLDNVPEETKDAGRGMGLTDASCSGASSFRWPCPRSSPAFGSRRPPRSGWPRSSSSPARAGSASRSSRTSPSSRTCSSPAALAVLLAVVLDGLILLVQRRSRRGPARWRPNDTTLAFLGQFGDAVNFIFHEHESPAGGAQVGGWASCGS